MPLTQEVDSVSTNAKKSRPKRTNQVVKCNVKAKLKILTLIREHKPILFGPISDKETKDTRLEKWKQIFNLASTLKVVPANKDYMYLRDVFWQNCKKYAIAKVENLKKTGKGSPWKHASITTCDKIALDIIGRGPEADGVKNDETMTFKQDYSASCSVTSTNNQTVPQEVRPHLQTRKRRTITVSEEPFAVKKQKLVLEHLQLINYKTKLEIAQMEQQLGYPSSVFTKDLDQGSGAARNLDNDKSVIEKWQYEINHNAETEEKLEHDRVEEGDDDDDEDFVEKDNKFIINLL